MFHITYFIKFTLINFQALQSQSQEFSNIFYLFLFHLLMEVDQQILRGDTKQDWSGTESRETASVRMVI